MSKAYHVLLEATLAHLQQLKSDGTRYLQVSAETWENLKAPAPKNAIEPSREKTREPISAAESLESTPRSKPDQETVLSKDPFGSTEQPETNPPAIPIHAQAKNSAMAELRERAFACRKCPHLADSRKSVVFGVGDMNADLMFVGEAPGAEEDAQGEPFVGKAGQLLTRIIQTMGFSRQTVYIANVLKCRPDTPGQAYGNRKPTPQEMKTCLPYLLAQIDLIQPKVLVALGATAMEGLFGRVTAITRERGRFQEFRGIPVMPTYHPSYLLRNAALEVKRQVWEDMLQVLERLNIPISEKQRNYFLKA